MLYAVFVNDRFGKTQLTVGSSIPGLVVLAAIESMVSKLLGSKPGSSTPRGLCFSSYHLVPALVSLNNVLWKEV